MATPSISFLLLSFIALGIGAMIPVQAATNAALGRVLGSAPLVALILFGIGFAFLAVWVLMARPVMPPLSDLRHVPVYGYIGGIIVACYLLSITFLAPRLGVGNAICIIVTGQILAAVLIDHFGLFGAHVQTLSTTRVVGVLLMIAGLFLARRM